MTIKKDIAIFLLLVVLCAIVTALNPRFLSPANLQNTARLIGAFGIFSLGLGLVIITSCCSSSARVGTAAHRPRISMPLIIGSATPVVNPMFRTPSATVVCTILTSAVAYPASA